MSPATYNKVTQVHSPVPQPDSQKRHRAYLALLLNALIWGAALPIVKPALAIVSPYRYLFIRYLIAAPLSLPLLIYLWKKVRLDPRTILTIIVLELVATTGALSFLYEGLLRTTSLEATLIANASPVFIILGGILLLHEKEERHEWIGLVLAIAGVTLLTVEPLISGRNHLGFSVVGNFFVLGHNLLWTSYILLAKHYYKNISKLFIGMLSLWVGLASFLLLTLVSEPASSVPAFVTGLWANLSASPVLIASAYMAILGSIVALPAYLYGNDRIEASEASLFTYLQPLLTIPLATLWLKEPINTLMIGSLIVIAVGVFLAERKKGALVD